MILSGKIRVRIRGKGRCGFTLLEMVVAVAIISLVLVLGVSFSSSIYRGESMRKTSFQFKKFTRTARALAVERGESVYLKFERDSFKIVLPEGQDDRGYFYLIPEGVSFEVKFWEDREWRTPQDEELWMVKASGLSEPLSVRFQSGESWVAYGVDVLTGLPLEEEFYSP